MKTAQLMDTDMSGWASGTQHWRTSDGENFAVEAALNGELPAGAVPFIEEMMAVVGTSLSQTTIVLRNTIIIECDPDGTPQDDVIPAPLHTFPPGTSHEEAIKLAGYEIGD